MKSFFENTTNNIIPIGLLNYIDSVCGRRYKKKRQENKTFFFFFLIFHNWLMFLRLLKVSG